MPELTKQDIREVFDEKLEPLATAIQKDFGEVKIRLGSIETRLGSVGVQLGDVNGRLTALESEWKEFKKNSSELFAKLDEFITLYKNHEEKDKVFTRQLARLEERVAKLEAKTKK